MTPLPSPEQRLPKHIMGDDGKWTVVPYILRRDETGLSDRPAEAQKERTAS